MPGTLQTIAIETTACIPNYTMTGSDKKNLYSRLIGNSRQSFNWR